MTANEVLHRLAGLPYKPWIANPSSGREHTRCRAAGRGWVERIGLSRDVWRAHLTGKPAAPGGLAAELAAVGIALVRTADPPGWTATLLQLAGGGRAEAMVQGLIPMHRGSIRFGAPELMHVDRDEYADDQPQADTVNQRQREKAAESDAFVREVEADGDELIDTPDARAVLGCSAATLTLLVRDEQLPAYVVRGRRRFRMSEVEALVEMFQRDPDDICHRRAAAKRRQASAEACT